MWYEFGEIFLPDEKLANMDCVLSYVSEFIVFINRPLIYVLVSCFLFGSFGGLAAHFINNEKNSTMTQNSILRDKGWFLYPSYFQSCCIGTAGALGFLLFIVAIGGLNSFGELAEQLRVISVCAISGFGARSLLPRMVGTLEKQIDKALDEAGKATLEARNAFEHSTQAEQKLIEANDRIADLEINSRLIKAIREERSFQLRNDILEKARKILKADKASARTWINVACLQRIVSKEEDAISILDELLSKVETGAISEDENYPIAFYNRACYSWKIFLRTSNDVKKVACLSDISEYLRLADDPTSEINDMASEVDFEGLSDLDEYKALVNRYKR